MKARDLEARARDLLDGLRIVGSRRARATLRPSERWLRTVVSQL
jgi:hypothetical protein